MILHKPIKAQVGWPTTPVDNSIGRAKAVGGLYEDLEEARRLEIEENRRKAREAEGVGKFAQQTYNTWNENVPLWLRMVPYVDTVDDYAELMNDVNNGNWGWATAGAGAMMLPFITTKSLKLLGKSAKDLEKIEKTAEKVRPVSVSAFNPERYPTNELKNAFINNIHPKAAAMRDKIAKEVDLTPEQYAYLSFLNPESPDYLKHVEDYKNWDVNVPQTFYQFKDRFNIPPEYINKFGKLVTDDEEFLRTKKVLDRVKRRYRTAYDPYDAKTTLDEPENFYHMLGAFANRAPEEIFDTFNKDLRMNKQLGNEFVVSTVTRPDWHRYQYELPKRYEAPKNVRLRIYPESDDIKWAATADNFSGSTGGYGKAFGEGVTGVSRSKTPKMSDLQKTSPDLAHSMINRETRVTGMGDIVDYNELGVRVRDNNYRFEYDDDVPDALKQKIDLENERLDRVFGKPTEPTKPMRGKFQTSEEEFRSRLAKEQEMVESRKVPINETETLRRNLNVLFGRKIFSHGAPAALTTYYLWKNRDYGNENEIR